MYYCLKKAHLVYLIIFILGDAKRFGELFTSDALIEIPKVNVKKQGTQEMEGKKTKEFVNRGKDNL